MPFLAECEICWIELNDFLFTFHLLNNISWVFCVHRDTVAIHSVFFSLCLCLFKLCFSTPLLAINILAAPFIHGQSHCWREQTGIRKLFLVNFFFFFLLLILFSSLCWFKESVGFVSFTTIAFFCLPNQMASLHCLLFLFVSIYPH